MLTLLLAFAAGASTAEADTAPPSKCTILGTGGDNRLEGTADDDVICALGGDDRVQALGGDDEVHAGAGRDIVEAAAGADTIGGSGGADRLEGGPGADSVNGENGEDALRGGAGDDFLYGEAGDDSLAGGSGDDGLWGDVGNDSLSGGTGQNHLSGGPGNNAGVADGPAPICPEFRDGSYCAFNMHFDAKVCPPFSAAQGTIPPCTGRTPYAPAGWSAPVFDYPGLWAGFSWAELGPRGGPRFVSYAKFPPFGVFEGRLPSSNSERLTITKAFSSSGAVLASPDREGVAAGQPGGPLYLNFVNGFPGADAYIDGYLVRAGTG